MAKLFISCPMRGLSGVEIAEMRAFMLKYAMLIWPEETFEVMETVIPPEDGHKRLNVHCLGRSIQLMADADYYIGIDDYQICDHHRGCEVENHVAREYMRPSEDCKYDRNLFFIRDASQIPAFKKLVDKITEEEQKRYTCSPRYLTPVEPCVAKEDNVNEKSED